MHSEASLLGPCFSQQTGLGKMHQLMFFSTSTWSCRHNFGLQLNLAATEFEALYKVIQIGSSTYIVGTNITVNKYTQGKMNPTELLELLQFSDILSSS